MVAINCSPTVSETPNTVVDTNSIDLTASGPLGRDISADVKTGCGLVTDTSGVRVLLDPAGNITCGPAGLATAGGGGTAPTAGCGIEVAGSVVSANVQPWPYACDLATEAGGVYCDPVSGELRSDPRCESGSIAIQIVTPAKSGHGPGPAEADETGVADSIEYVVSTPVQAFEFTNNCCYPVHWKFTHGGTWGIGFATNPYKLDPPPFDPPSYNRNGYWYATTEITSPFNASDVQSNSNGGISPYGYQPTDPTQGFNYNSTIPTISEHVPHTGVAAPGATITVTLMQTLTVRRGSDVEIGFNTWDLWGLLEWQP